jgi:hypothetical protein
MVSEEFFLCPVCKKKIAEDAMKCPILKKLVHKGCMRIHVHKCGSFHKKFRYWGAAAYKKNKNKKKEVCVIPAIKKPKNA